MVMVFRFLDFDSEGTHVLLDAFIKYDSWIGLGLDGVLDFQIGLSRFLTRGGLI